MPDMSTPASATRFSSKLGQGTQRLLAHAIEHGFEIGRRKPDDFVRHFSPAAIMRSLSDRPDLRAKILVDTTGIRHKIALRKGDKTAGEDLQFALDERETDAATIVKLFDPDDRVRYLDAKAIWAYVAEGDFWKGGKDDEVQRGRDHIGFLLERALADKVITEKDIVDGIGVGRLVDCLPKPDVTRVLTQVLRFSQDKKPFAEGDLVAVVPVATLVAHVPLSEIWERVIVARLAEPGGLTGAAPVKAAPAAKETPAEAKPAAQARAESPKAESPKAEEAPKAADKAKSKNGAARTAAPTPVKESDTEAIATSARGSVDDELLAGLEADDDLLEGGEEDLEVDDDFDELVDSLREKT